MNNIENFANLIKIREYLNGVNNNAAIVPSYDRKTLSAVICQIDALILSKTLNNSFIDSLKEDTGPITSVNHALKPTPPQAKLAEESFDERPSFKTKPKNGLKKTGKATPKKNA